MTAGVGGVSALLLALWGLPGLLLHTTEPEAPAHACTCRAARTAGGWCGAHRVGYVAGVSIASRWLYDAVDTHGHEVDLATFGCPRCREAIAADGWCAEHRVGFADGKAWFTRLTHHLAKGEVRAPSSLGCATCRRNAHGHGWCDACKVGMVGGVALRDRRHYDEAVHDLEVLLAASAAASRCDRCAVAMITDTTCPLCGVPYRDGEAVGGRGASRAGRGRGGP